MPALPHSLKHTFLCFQFVNPGVIMGNAAHVYLTMATHSANISQYSVISSWCEVTCVYSE